MTAIDTTKIVHDSTLWIRDKVGTITDPMSGKRVTNSTFVMTTFPDRPVTYPVITVKCRLGADRPAGIATEARFVALIFEITIWSKSVKERDTLSDSVYDKLRTVTHDSDGSAASGLYDFRVSDAFDIDEEGAAGLHRKVIKGNYRVIAGG